MWWQSVRWSSALDLWFEKEDFGILARKLFLYPFQTFRMTRPVWIFHLQEECDNSQSWREWNACGWVRTFIMSSGAHLAAFKAKGTTQDCFVWGYVGFSKFFTFIIWLLSIYHMLLPFPSNGWQRQYGLVETLKVWTRILWIGGTSSMSYELQNRSSIYYLTNCVLLWR